MFRKPSLLAAAIALGTGIFAGGAWAAPKGIGSCTSVSNPGSYVLTNTINGTGAAGDCISIDASFVTVDMNGFTVVGPGAIGGSPGGTGIKAGIGTQDIAVRNGKITGFVIGLELAGPGSLVEEVQAIGNENTGISVAEGAIVNHNLARENANIGIVFGAGSTVIYNIARGNGSSGSDAGILGDCPSTVVGNTSTDNNNDLTLISSLDCTAAHNTTD